MSRLLFHIFSVFGGECLDGGNHVDVQKVGWWVASQGQVLSKDFGPIPGLGLGAWLRAEVHGAGPWSRPRPSTLRVGPPGGAGATVIPPRLGSRAAPQPWPGRPRGVVSTRPRHQSLAGLGGKRGKTGKTEPELNYGARQG